MPVPHIPEEELSYTFVRASGPGGQNVNKVSTAVELRFDVLNSPSLSPGLRGRLLALAGRRVNAEGILIITARAQRTQEQNRAAARARLDELLRQAAVPPRPRRATRPTLASRERRLEAKKQHGRIKRLRRQAPDGE